MQWMTRPVARSRIVTRVPRGRYQVAQCPGMYRYHVASPMRYLTGFFFLGFSVVVVTGLQIVVVVVGAGVVVVDVGVVVGAAPGTVVEVGSDVVVVATVVVLGAHVGLGIFFTVVVVTGL
jgi:hypothetical protein